MKEGTLPQTFSSYDGEFEVRNEVEMKLLLLSVLLLGLALVLISAVAITIEHSYPHLLPLCLGFCFLHNVGVDLIVFFFF